MRNAPRHFAISNSGESAGGRPFATLMPAVLAALFAKWRRRAAPAVAKREEARVSPFIRLPKPATDADSAGTAIAVHVGQQEAKKMRTVEINQDMDAATMLDLKPLLEELAQGRVDVRLDLRGVGFIDSSGVGGIVFLFKRLREKSLGLRLGNVQGQPLSLMRHLRLGFLIDQAEGGAAA